MEICWRRWQVLETGWKERDLGAADAVTKSYIRKNEVFADAFNYFMYDGEQKIQPDQLREAYKSGLG